MKKTKVMVLGAEGFIGSHMVKFLKKKGYKVYTSMGDLRSYNTVLRNTEGMDWVFNFAANFGGVGYFSKQQYYPTVDNYLIDLNVLRACEKNKVKRLFYPASACAYPLYQMTFEEPLSEEMLDQYADPDQMYGWEKLSMIKLMRYSPVDCRVGILHTIYGAGQEFKGDKAKFPPQIAYKAIQSEKTGILRVWGNGKQTRTFLYVDDAIEKIYQVMTKKYHGEVNIGSDKEVSVDDVIDICLKNLEIEPRIEYQTDKPTGPERRTCSNEKFNKHYKYRDKVSLSQGFNKIINFIIIHI